MRAANRATFGVDAVPRYDEGVARCVIAFGADFLETFASPVSQARGYAALRTKRDDGAGYFVTVESRLSTTGANADEWVAPKPGSEFALALRISACPTRFNHEDLSFDPAEIAQPRTESLYF